MAHTVLSAQALADTLIKAGFNPTAVDAGHYADAEYACPSEHWLNQELPQEWQRNLKSLGLKYQEEVFDCDDFALTCAGWIRLTHRWNTVYNSNATTRGGIAFGVLWYNTKEGFGHAINFAVYNKSTAEQPDFGLCFFEPQTGAVLLLQREEINSAWMLYV